MTTGPKNILKSILLGVLIVYACLIPLGFFESWFWNNWSWGDPEHIPQTGTLKFWMGMTCDALLWPFGAIFKMWFVTFPFIAIYSRWIFKRKQKQQTV